MKTIISVFSIAFLFMLSGCGDAPSGTETSASESTTSERTNPLQKQVDALQKAKDLEAEMQKSVQDRLKAIDGQK